MKKSGFTLIHIAIFLALAGVVATMFVRFAFLNRAAMQLDEYDRKINVIDNELRFSLKKYGTLPPAKVGSGPSGFTNNGTENVAPFQGYWYATNGACPDNGSEALQVFYCDKVGDPLCATGNYRVLERDAAYILVGPGMDGVFTSGYGEIAPGVKGLIIYPSGPYKENGLVLTNDDQVLWMPASEMKSLAGCDRPDYGNRPRFSTNTELPRMNTAFIYSNQNYKTRPGVTYTDGYYTNFHILNPSKDDVCCIRQKSGHPVTFTTSCYADLSYNPSALFTGPYCTDPVSSSNYNSLTDNVTYINIPYSELMTVYHGDELTFEIFYNGVPAVYKIIVYKY